MGNLEQKALTRIGASLKARGAFFYKIPDSIRSVVTRFTPSKPADAIIAYAGRAALVEAKHMRGYQAFGLRHLRASQTTGLAEWSKTGSPAYVVLNVTQRRQESTKAYNHVLVFEWDAFARKGRYTKAELMGYPHVEYRRKDYDLSGWLFDIEVS